MFSLPLLFAGLAPDASLRKEVKPASFTLLQFDTLLPGLDNELFTGSGSCVSCHGYDTSGVASVDAMGNDVNVVDDWRATMMGNAAKDPFWRAKVSHEVLTYPQHQAAIEDKCTACHAPLGHFNAKHAGLAHYSMNDLYGDELAQDGVSCLACHQMSENGLGLSFSGIVNYDTFQVAYGPFENPLVSPMVIETGYKPEYSEHISDAGICAGCHTLITETIDYEGNFTGNTFVEQATYHEWLNSSYKDSVSCQGCHMPSLDKYPVFLVTGSQTEPRSPFSQHEFVGGNVTMLKLLRDNIEELDLKASASQFDEVIAKTMAMLQNRSLLVEVEEVNRTADTAFIAVALTNLAGHKFPSGYPARRAFIELTVQTEGGDTLFISGKTDEDFEVYGQNDTYEPHYQTIRSEDQVQIYELVLGDVNGDVTTVLERADQPIKDNRLPPAGFTTQDPVYDTTRIAGGATTDLDFNRNGNLEGTGSDIVYYHIPMNGNLGPVQVSTRVYYQSTPPKWMKEMFDVSTPEIETFRTLFDAADRTPVLMKSANIWLDPVSAVRPGLQKEVFARIFPVPSDNGIIFIRSDRTHEVKVFSPDGRLQNIVSGHAGEYQVTITGKGVFILQFTDQKGYVQTERIIIQ